MDGGRTALGGFFYQVVGLMALRASADDITEEVASAPGIDMMVTLVREGHEIRHEELDEDGVLYQFGLTVADTCILVQYKYSQQAKPESIGPEALSDIALRFREATLKAQGHGLTVSRYVLITNRHISSDEKGATYVAPNVVSDSLNNLPYCRITRIPENEWIARLMTYGRTLGCFDAEIQDGIYQLVGKLIADAGHGESSSITSDRLKKALTGFPEAHPLTANSIYLEDELSYHQYGKDLAISGQAVWRKKEGELNDAAKRRAIILVDGAGGTGKSVLVWQWMLNLRAQMLSGEAACVALRHSDDIRHHYFACLLREWAHDYKGTRGRSGEIPEDFFGRLQQANPKATPPLFVLALDGLDERGSRIDEHAINEVIRWFLHEDRNCQRENRAPRAVLVMTWRETDLDDPRNLWFTHEGHGIGEEIALQRITLDDFTEGELQLAIRNNLPQSLHWPGLLTSLDLTLLNNSNRAGSLFGRLQEIGDSLPPDRLKILRHPVVWNTFVRLTQDKQERILAGDETTFAELVRNYLSRFGRKAGLRGILLTPQEILNALQPLALFCQQHSTLIFSRADFIEYVTASSIPTKQEIPLLYKEAFSWGLIVQQSQSRWSWKYHILRDRLALTITLNVAGGQS